MYYLHHRVDENTNYVVDTSDWSMNVLDDANVEGAGVSGFPSVEELDVEDDTVTRFWEYFAGTDESDVNAYFMTSSELYPLTEYLATKMDTYLRFDAKIDIWKADEYLFCRGYTASGLCICWYTDGETIEFFSFSGLDINQPFVEPVEDLQAAIGHSLWDGEGEAGVFYTPAMSKIAFVRFMDSVGISRPELLLFDWGKDTFLYQDEE